MEKYLFIQPRQTGKTSRAVYEYSKNTKESILFVDSYSHLEDIKEKYVFDCFETKCIITYPSTALKYLGENIKNLIFDDYTSDKYEVVKETIDMLSKTDTLEKVYIFTTDFKEYDKDIIAFIKKLKMHNIDYGVLDKFLSKGLFGVEFYELYNSFLTDPTFTIIERGFKNG